MLIVCPNCTTSYQVDTSAIGMAGRSVRCVRCKTTWFTPPAPEVAALVSEAAPRAAATEAEAFARDEAAFSAELAEGGWTAPTTEPMAAVDSAPSLAADASAPASRLPGPFGSSHDRRPGQGVDYA